MPSGFPQLEILYEDNHLLVVNKPAALPTMGVATGKPSVLEAARHYIAQKYQKPGNVYLGIVSRLDAPVTGVLVMARTSKAASRLSDAFRLRQVEKTYWAVALGNVEPVEARLEHYLRKDERHKRVHVTHGDCPDAQVARLAYRRLAAHHDLSLVEIRLETGRKHQIRVQMAKVGWPILGDLKYGGGTGFSPGIALHARRLALIHPVRRQPLAIEAPVPSSWSRRPDILSLLEASNGT